MPEDLSLAAAAGPKEGLPSVLMESASLRLWQRTDLRFENPKATIVLDFQVCRGVCVCMCVKGGEGGLPK